MYIKLGNITVNRRQSIDDFIIFMEVIDSSMSFERPVFVRNPEQLDIWFGKNFSDREYFIELLERGVSLYLYKPISKQSDFPDYIDLDQYQEYSEEVTYYNIQDLPEIPNLSIKYNISGTYYVYLDSKGYILLSDVGKYVDRPREYVPLIQPKEFANTESLPEIGEEGIKYKVLESDLWYIWLGSWVSENELLQNLKNESLSLNNRDTLAITDPGIENLPKYFYPEYREYAEDHLGLFSELKNLPNISIGEDNIAYYDDGDIVDIDSDSILDGDSSLSIREIYTGNINGAISEGFQLIQNISDNSGNTVATRSNGAITFGEYTLPSELYSKRVFTTNIFELKNVFLSCGYGVDVIESGKEISVYSGKPFDLTYMNSFKEIHLENDQGLNNRTLTQMFMPYVNFEMWSKTIGRDSEDYGEDKNIKISIEKLETFKYRIKISRYDYSESFEGSLFPDPGQSRLDDLISRGSNLVCCEIKQGTTALRTGDFTLRGAKVETYNKEMYWKSLEVLCGEEIYPDYFLIPDLNKYVNSLDKNYSYYIEYKKFLDIAKELNCQVLIQNSDSPYKLEIVDSLPEKQEDNTIYKVGNLYYLNGKALSDQYLITLAENGNDFIFNYTKDSENRLVYFFRCMTSYLRNMPGYYIYTSGLLDNIFSASPNDIVYNTPVSYPYDLDLKVIRVENLPKIPRTDTVYIIGDDYYLGSEKITNAKTIASIDDELVKEQLEKYKSNYLVYNNQMYYYRGYENGEDYETTAWMRFAIGKVSRELQKNKWSYLSLKNVGKIRENIVAILSRITRSFSVVRSIEITLFKPVMSENRIELTLDVNVADLVDNNIVLDLTINYNKED